ncbi:MAG: hypothetical protein HYY16_18735 [Planctomycetes bacterium]|nr:hypothetical protein [Planctomycetota bacterium]
MSDPQKRTLGRTVFNTLAIVTLVGFVIFSVGITVCTAYIPSLRRRAEERRLSRYVRKSVQYRDLRFGADDATLSYERVEQLEEPDGQGRDSRTLRESAPTGRLTRESAKRDLRLTSDVLRQLLRHYGLVEDPLLQVAVSNDYREIAFVNRGVVRRDAAGRFHVESGEPLPEVLARLQDVRGTLENADPQAWADAAIDSVLTDGVRPGIFADRLIRVHRERPEETEALIGVLLKIDTAEATEEIARAALAVRDATLQRRLIEGAQSRPRRQAFDPQRPEGDRASRRALLSAAAAREWGDGPTDFVVGWALSALEDGTFADLDGDARRGLLDRLAKYLTPSYAGRLARAVESRSALEAAAAYGLLRRLVGEVAEQDSQDLEAARAWVAELRRRKPELFREP